MGQYEIIEEIGVSGLCLLYTHNENNGTLSIRPYVNGSYGGDMLTIRLSKSIKLMTLNRADIKDLIAAAKVSGNSTLKEYANSEEFKPFLSLAINKIKNGFDDALKEWKEFHEEKELRREEEEKEEVLLEIEMNREEGKRLFENLEVPLSQYVEDVFEKLFPGNGKLAVIYWASALATVQGQPQMAIIRGNPGEGKSVLMEYILEAIPERFVIDNLKGAKEPTLYNLIDIEGEDYLDGKIVYLGDLGDKNGFKNTLEMRNILREMQTEGQAKRPVNKKVKTEEGVQDWKPVYQNLYGKPAMWFTTVRNDADKQDLDRSIVSTTNLQMAKSTKRIMRYIDTPTKTGRHLNYVINVELRNLKYIFEYLSELELDIFVPYKIEDMEYLFRDTGRIIKLSSMITLLDHPYREVYKDVILVGHEDIKRIARFLYEESGKLNNTVLKNLDKLYQIYGKTGIFGRDDAFKLFTDTYSDTSNMARDLLNPAIEENILSINDERIPYKYQFIISPTRDDFNIESLEIDWEEMEEEFNYGE